MSWAGTLRDPGGVRRWKARVEDADEDEDELIEWDHQSYKDMILWLIDAGPSMHDTLIEVPTGEDDDDEEPKTRSVSLFQRALMAAATLQRNKLVSSPNDQVGILLFNTGDTKVSDAGKTQAYPHCVTLQRIGQVDVPPLAQLNDDLAAAENDPSFLRNKYKPRSQQIKIHHALGNAESMLNVGKAGSKRVFFVTNVDDPFAGKPGKDEMQRLCLEKVKSMTKRGIEFEPFLISTEERSFDTTRFYGDLFSVYQDDNLISSAPSGNDSSTYTRKAWNASTKFEDLESELAARETPKRVVFSVSMSLGHGCTMGVKGYCLVSKATKGFPVKTVARRGDDEDDEDEPVTYHEVHTETFLQCLDTGRELTKGEIEPAFSFGSEGGLKSKVRFTDAEMRALRTFGQRPGIKILGFKPREELLFWENTKRSYFIYPSDEAWKNSQRCFAALLRSMASKNLMAIAVFMPRHNVIPAFVALLPQMEERDADGQKEPPGMHVITLPFADDIREPPEKLMGTLEASAKEVAAAKELVTKYSMKAPFNPDLYFNPALKYHYDTLLATAFGEPLPDPAKMADKSIPAYETIKKRVGHLISDFNDVVAANPLAATGATTASGALISSKTRDADFTAEDDKLLRKYHAEGTVGRFTVAKLKAACDYYRIGKSGKKLDLVEGIVKHLDKEMAMEQEL